jgi:two-component system LytT family response regulator
MSPVDFSRGIDGTPFESEAGFRILAALLRQLDFAESSLVYLFAELLAAREQERVKQRIVVPTSTGELILDVDEIDWIEADDYYAAVHARAGRHLIRESLTSLEQRLDRSQFLRTHRSAIVNVDRVCELRKEAGEAFLILRNGVRIPVSRRRRPRVTRLLDGKRQ